jgi:mRNA-degrading endonuclease RelE of RelBE toxin-antitoxin system
MREIFVYDFRVIYNIEEEEVVKIAAIKHGKSLLID